MPLVYLDLRQMEGVGGGVQETHVAALGVEVAGGPFVEGLLAFPQVGEVDIVAADFQPQWNGSVLEAIGPIVHNDLVELADRSEVNHDPLLAIELGVETHVVGVAIDQ